MRNFKSLFLCLPMLLCAARVAAAPAVDFDRGAGRPVQLLLEEASTGGGVIAPELLSTGDTVWVSMARQEVAALDEEIFKRAPVAQNENVSVYEFRASDLDKIADSMRRKFLRAPGFFAYDTLAAALQDLAEPAAPAARAYTIDQGEKVEPMLKLISEDSIVSVITTLAAYKNRNYRTATGIAASKWVYDHWTELAAGRPDIDVASFKHAAFPQESVILTMRGAVEPDKVVVIGGHEDSLAGSGDSPAPGADDNASGIAVTNEVIRVLLASGYKPAKTIKFIAFAAEEAGLRGSGELAAKFKKDAVAVQGMLNLDMTNYKGSPQDIYLFSDNASADQNTFITKLLAAYTNYTWGTSKCGYACSDYASWTKNGFAASMPGEATYSGSNPSIHSANDTLAQTGGRAEHSVKFAKMAVAYAVEMAK